MSLFDNERFDGVAGDDWSVFLALVAVGSAVVGYEFGSVLAGDSFDPLWLVPILVLLALVGSTLVTDS